MKNRQSKAITRGEVLGITILTLIFILSIFVSNRYSEQIEGLVFLEGLLGMLLYVLLSVASIVLAPIAAVPFIPVAVKIWGSFLTAILSLVGWLIGASIAFILAKKYGRPFVKKFVSLERAEEVAKRITRGNLFWSVLISRILLPVDVLSYAIGLFIPIRFRSFVLATALGMAPIAFTLSYGVSLPLIGQVVLGVAIVLMSLITILFSGKESKDRE